jgi:hypothetical protein
MASDPTIAQVIAAIASERDGDVGLIS